MTGSDRVTAAGLRPHRHTCPAPADVLQDSSDSLSQPRSVLHSANDLASDLAGRPQEVLTQEGPAYHDQPLPDRQSLLSPETAGSCRSRGSRPLLVVVAAQALVKPEGGSDDTCRGASSLDREVERRGHVQVSAQEAADLGDGIRAGRGSATGGVIQILQPRGHGIEQSGGVIPAIGPVTVEDHQPDCRCEIIGEQVVQQDQVASGLGHLGSLNSDFSALLPEGRVTAARSGGTASGPSSHPLPVGAGGAGCDTMSHVVSELVKEVWLMPET